MSIECHADGIHNATANLGLGLFDGFAAVLWMTQCCYELEFTTLLQCVAYATYVGVTLAAYIAYPSKSNGVQDCIYEDKTACSHGPDGAIRLREAPGGGGGITQMPLCWTEATEIEKRTAGRHTHTHTQRRAKHMSTFNGCDGSAASPRCLFTSLMTSVISSMTMIGAQKSKTESCSCSFLVH